MQKQLKVAIVEDNAYSVDSLSNYLEGVGFFTVKAYRADDAEKLCENEKPDLLLLDASMKGMSGIDVAKALPKQKVLFMCAENEDERKASKVKNSIGIIKKPINLIELNNLIRKHFS